MWVKHSPEGGEDKTPSPSRGNVGMGGLKSLPQSYVDREPGYIVSYDIKWQMKQESRT